MSHLIEATEKSLFSATVKQPYHLSIGAVLFNQNGQIACHHFKNFHGQEHLYILMRESMENDETLIMTLNRGLKEEFGATAKPIAFLGGLMGFLYDSKLPFEKTTIYIACELIDWDPSLRYPDDPEGMSTIEWLEPNDLIAIMIEQGKRLKRVDVDESEMIRRALNFVKISEKELKTSK